MIQDLSVFTVCKEDGVGLQTVFFRAFNILDELSILLATPHPAVQIAGDRPATGHTLRGA